jgi:hypothetical protein
MTFRRGGMLGERMRETTWTTRDNFFKVRRLNGRRVENEWESGRDFSHKGHKGHKGGRETGGILH